MKINLTNRNRYGILSNRRRGVIYGDDGETWEREISLQRELQGQRPEEPVQEVPENSTRTQQVRNIVYPTVDDILNVADTVVFSFNQEVSLWGGRGPLDAAIGRMQSSFSGQEFYPTLFEKAAILVHSITSTHPFSEGNKRISTMSGLWFLEMNGVRPNANVDEEELQQLIWGISEHKIDYTELVEWLKRNYVEPKQIQAVNQELYSIGDRKEVVYPHELLRFIEPPEIKPLEQFGQTKRNLPMSIPEVQIYTITTRFTDDPKLGQYMSSHKSEVPGVYKVFDIYRNNGYTVYTVDPINKMADMALSVSFDTYSEAVEYAKGTMAKRAQKEKYKPLSEFESMELNDGTQVFLARDSAEINQGLLGLKSEDFTDNMVMLFFVHGGTFHMDGMTFPIDISFLDNDGKILKLERMIPDKSYVPAPSETSYALEANVNWFKSRDLEVGSILPLFEDVGNMEQEETRYTQMVLVSQSQEEIQKKAQTEIKFDQWDYDDVMAKRVRNEYYVSVSNEYMVLEGNTLNPASQYPDKMLPNEVWGKTVAKYYDYPSAIEHAGKIYDEIQESGTPSKENINSVFVEDYVSGELFSGELQASLVNVGTVDEEWEYTKHGYESTEFTDKKLKEIGYPNGINSTKEEIDGMEFSGPEIKPLEQFG